MEEHGSGNMFTILTIAADSEFSTSWWYTMSDLVGKCRRQVLLDLFGEDASS